MHYRNFSLERRLEIAFHAILRHELFHFATDCMAANWELATNMPVYWYAKCEYRDKAGCLGWDDGRWGGPMQAAVHTNAGDLRTNESANAPVALEAEWLNTTSKSR
jgi:hypothetical protein